MNKKGVPEAAKEALCLPPNQVADAVQEISCSQVLMQLKKELTKMKGFLHKGNEDKFTRRILKDAIRFLTFTMNFSFHNHRYDSMRICPVKETKILSYLSCIHNHICSHKIINSLHSMECKNYHNQVRERERLNQKNKCLGIRKIKSHKI